MQCNVKKDPKVSSSSPLLVFTSEKKVAEVFDGDVFYEMQFK